MVRTLTGIYTVKIYQGPVCIVEGIRHLEIVMCSVDTICIKKREGWKKEEKAYKLFEDVQFHR